ncbi:uncharacterized protein LOC121385280 isoform X2 [Gigantopelta aegis]|uniref:uncharacterized protein LOC121385280 isoform X2 n=1 Tax=Gigantopelta aegis TaxID=1735272 RepID=UPI001B88E0E2|nr:uncharacterized protein LOC121385280 isoform X2 [Gigantopelta aegis]
MQVEQVRLPILRIDLSEKRNDLEMEERNKILNEDPQLLVSNRNILRPYSPWWQQDAVHLVQYSHDDDDDKDDVVDDVALDHFINRILFSATTNDSYEDTYGSGIKANLDGGQVTKPVYADHDLHVPSYERRNRKLKSRNKKKMRVEDYICDKVISPNPHQNREPFIRMPVRIYRKLVNAEIESKAREMYEYFLMQNSQLEDSRIEVIKESFVYQDQLDQCERSLTSAYTAIRNIHEDCENLQHVLLGLGGDVDRSEATTQTDQEEEEE